MPSENSGCIFSHLLMVEATTLVPYLNLHSYIFPYHTTSDLYTLHILIRTHRGVVLTFTQSNQTQNLSFSWEIEMSSIF